jgi:hypothetical protein
MARPGVAEAGRSMAATAAAKRVSRASRELGLGFARARERERGMDRLGRSGPNRSGSVTGGLTSGPRGSLVIPL